MWLEAFSINQIVELFKLQYSIKYVPRHYRGLDILGSNELIKSFCLVMVKSGMPQTLSWLIKFEDLWNSNNSRNVLAGKLFFAYGYINIGVTGMEMLFFIWVCIHRSNKLIRFPEMGDFYCPKACLQYFKMIFQRYEVWRCFFHMDMHP